MARPASPSDRRRLAAAALQRARLDLTMLLMSPGGRERSEAEYGALLREAGFELRRAIPTESAFSILESVSC